MSTEKKVGIVWITTLAVLVIAGCVSKVALPRHTPDTTNYVSTAPQIQQAVTTQKTATEQVAANDRNAAGDVGAADGNVVAVNAEKPDPRLSSAHTDLADAGKKLAANDETTKKIIASQQDTINKLTDHVQADAKLKAGFDAEAAKAADWANKYEVEHAARETSDKFIADHAHDVWGAGTHRVVKGLGIATLITLAVLAIALGILGSIYGLPSITQPAFTAAGTALNWVRLALGKASTFIWACIPVIGHYIDEALTDLHILKKAATVKQVAVPTSPAPVATGSAPCSSTVADMLLKYGVKV